MKIQTGRWYWTREGLIAWISYEASRSIFEHRFYGYILRFCVDGGAPHVPEFMNSWKENGRWGIDQDDEWDLVTEPASRERIVFPHPSTCPRWNDALRREQKELEEVLFD